MGDQPELKSIEAQARFQSEFSKPENQSRGVRFLIIFMVAVLGFGGLSLLLPNTFWRPNTLEIRIAPQMLFVGMMVALVLLIYLVGHESEVRKLRLLALQQVIAAQAEHSASMFDAVTNVFTRNFLHELLQGEIARAERNNRPLGLIMCDVNNFKQVNDRYGHLIGDAVLAQVAGILKSCVRGSDHVVRYGGDEFLLILPETDDEGAQIVCGRIQEKMMEWDRSHRIGKLPVSVSMGWHLHRQGQSAEQDIAEADARMYKEKQAGHSNVANRASTAKAAVPSATPAPHK